MESCLCSTNPLPDMNTVTCGLMCFRYLLKSESENKIYPAIDLLSIRLSAHAVENDIPTFTSLDFDSI